ncbi:MAG TPA: exodeoxyribonuclease III [Spirochaetota bacterium]|jgi:exodeoxyribonuclease-3|nr:exodeoxyribonuclease III [Spirochaetota bacterium]
MKIATYNANSIRARMPVIERWLAASRPDVLCIQETKVVDDDFPAAEIEALGYRAVFHGEKSYNGVAVLSRHDIEGVSCGFDGNGNDEGTRLIAVRVQGVDIVNTYVPQGTSPDSDRFQYKLQWFGRLLEYFNMRFTAGDRLVWLGDFNVAPEPIDVHDPKRLLGHVGYHPDEHRALAAVKAWGFVDIFRKHHPEAGHYTFWDYRVRDSVARGMGWRVDHIWGTGAMAALSVGASIDREPRMWEKPSDHTPLIAEFSL